MLGIYIVLSYFIESIFKFNVSIKVIVLGVAMGFPTLANAGLFGGDCPDAPDIDKPKWVKQNYNYSEAGYLFGFGEARFKDNKAYDDLIKEAEGSARQDLVSAINISIEASNDYESKLIEKGNSADSHSQFKSSFKTSTKIELPGLETEKWQNPSSCHVYVLVRLKDDIVGLVVMKSKALGYHAKAKNTSLSIGERIFFAKEAIARTEKFEFADIQGSDSSSQLRRQFQHTLLNLQNQQQKFNHAVVLINNTESTDSEALRPLFSTLMQSMNGSFELPKDCSNATMCLREANQTSANYLSVATVQMNTNKQSGFWVGNIEVDISLTSLKDNHKLYISDKLSTRVMHRQKHKLTLANAMAKWQRQHGQRLNDYIEAAQQASN